MTFRDPLFGDKEKKLETVASEINSVISSSSSMVSPINGKPLKPYLVGDFEVMADLESRVVFPSFKD